jgi:hypothetical protein
MGEIIEMRGTREKVKEERKNEREEIRMCGSESSPSEV